MAPKLLDCVVGMSIHLSVCYLCACVLAHFHVRGASVERESLWIIPWPELNFFLVRITRRIGSDEESVTSSW